MPSRRLLAATVMILAATAVAAQMSQGYKDSFDGPEGFLMTSQERSQWKEIRTDAAADEFIALFWARRDPDLLTPENEFRVDFEERVAAADKLFGHGGTRGAMTARGRTLLLLGMCDKWYDLPSGSKRGQDVFERFGGGWAYVEQGAVQIWEYASSRFPADRSPEYIYVAFGERNPNSGDFDFIREKRSNLHTFLLLEQAPGWTVKHADLAEPPRPGVLPGSLAASSAQLAWLDAAGQPGLAGAGMVTREGVFPGPRHFLWVRLVLPPDVEEPRTLVGRVDRSSGGGGGTFAVPAKAAAAGDGAYELAVPLPPGTWTLDLAAAGEQGPLAVTHAGLTTTAMPEHGTWFSPMIWGARLEKREGAAPGAPFVLAGLHVESRPGGTYTPQEKLSYLAHVFRPVLDESGEPHVACTLIVTRGGSEVVRSGPSPVTLSRLTEDVWLFGGRMPLSRFTEAGDYVLTVELEQQGGGSRHVQKIPFIITGAT